MLRFQMRGSAGDIYEVTADRVGDAMIVTCTCEAARKAMHCHHRLELLYGDVGALASGNAADVKQLHAMLSGSTLDAAMKELDAAEAAQRAAKAERDRRMKTIDRLLARGAP